MRWLCNFFQCRWLHIFNVGDMPGADFGVYQCSRCKTISVGAPRYYTTASTRDDIA